MNHLATVKNYLRHGKVAQLTQWAKQNQVKNISQLIDQAAKEIAKERK